MSHPGQTQPPRLERFCCVRLFCGAVILLVGCCFWCKVFPFGNGKQRVASNFDARPNTVGTGARLASGDEPRREKVRAIVKYWDEHKAYYKNLVEIRYPKALAMSRAAVDATALDKFRHGCWAIPDLASVEQRTQQLNPVDQKMGENLSKLENIRNAMQYVWMLNDAKPVTDQLTVRDLATQALITPSKVNVLRSDLISAENLAFHDQATAEKLHDMLDDEVIAYMREAQSRYEALERQIMAKLPVDADVLDFTARQRYSTLVGFVAWQHEQSCRQAPEELVAQFHEAAEAKLNLPLLKEMSRDDAEARRILTEWRELEEMMDQEKTEAAGNKN